MRGEKHSGVKDDSRYFGLCNWKNKNAIAEIKMIREEKLLEEK